MKNFLLVIQLLFVITHSLYAGNNSASISVKNFDILARKIDSLTSTHGAQARILIQQLYQIAEQSPDSLSLRNECIYREAVLSYEQGIYDSVLVYRIQAGLSKAITANETYYTALLRYSLSLTHVSNGRFNEAFSNALQALESFKQENESQFIARTLLLLGRICTYIESYNVAENYYNEALSYTNSTQIEYYQIQTNRYGIWVRSGQMDAALDSIFSYLPILKEKEYTGLLASSYLNIGLIYFMKEMKEEAFHYYSMAQNILEAIDNIRLSTSLYQNRGAYYLRFGDLKNASQNFRQAKIYADKSGNLNLQTLSLLGLSYIYNEQNNIDSAYFYLNEYNNTRNEIFDNIKPIEAYQSYISAMMENTQKELTIKKQEILLKNRYLIVLVISAISIFLLIFSWLIILQQQKRHSRQQAILKEAENKDLEERLQSKLLIEQLQTERIDVQTRELTTYSLALSNKNSILQQIASAIQKQPNDITVLCEIKQMIKNNLNVDKAWEDFVLHFEKVHPSFFNKIKTTYHDISENDLRLCAYFRIGMSAKQIAQILNVSSDSIKMHRYRMKKKLNLSEDQSLDDFIRNI